MFGADEAVSVPQAASNSDRPRKRFTKQELLERFQQDSELDFAVFYKESLLQHAEIFQSSNDGLGKVPEALSGNLPAEGPVIAAI